MRVLVIGGTGFIGPHIVRRLLGRGHEVSVLHRGHMEAGLPDSVSHIHADISSLPDDHRFEADVVIHVYALSQEDAQTAVRLFRGRAGKLVVLSSGDVYRAYGVLCGTETGSLAPVPITETSRLRTALYPYPEKMPDYEKILVERTVMAAPDLPACILRLPAVYGPGDRNHRFLGWVKRMDDQRPAILLGQGIARWRWTHGYVENVAEAIAFAATDPRASGCIYNIGEAETRSSRDRLHLFAGAAGWRGRVEIVDDSLLPPFLRLPLNFKQDMAVSTTRFREELGYRDPVSEDEAIARTIAWERSTPPESVNPASFDYAAEDAVLAAAE